MSSSPPDWPVGVDRRILDETDSTNAEAARLNADPGGPVWVLARRQTRGRGRRGRAWRDPEGNFAATFLQRPASLPSEAALRSFVAALALADALEAVAGVGDRLTLKWPNDVLLDGAKLAGILLEAGAGYLCVGIGVNLAAAPDPLTLEPDALAPVSLLAATGQQIAPETLLNDLAPAYDRWDRQLRQFGFAPVRTAFLSRAAAPGQGVTARIGTRRVQGVFDTIDESGALVLRTPEGRVTLAAADVHFSEPPKDRPTSEARHASGN